MSAWKEFKKKIGNTPIALLDAQSKVSEEVAKERMDICEGCEHLVATTKQCRKCGCFMKLKVTLKRAHCPIDKWGTVE